VFLIRTREDEGARKNLRGMLKNPNEVSSPSEEVRNVARGRKGRVSQAGPEARWDKEVRILESSNSPLQKA